MRWSEELWTFMKEPTPVGGVTKVPLNIWTWVMSAVERSLNPPPGGEPSHLTKVAPAVPEEWIRGDTSTSACCCCSTGGWRWG